MNKIWKKGGSLETQGEKRKTKLQNMEQRETERANSKRGAIRVTFQIPSDILRGGRVEVTKKSKNGKEEWRKNSIGGEGERIRGPGGNQEKNNQKRLSVFSFK